jgi:hypothetical protein
MSHLRPAVRNSTDAPERAGPRSAGRAEVAEKSRGGGERAVGAFSKIFTAGMVAAGCVEQTFSESGTLRLGSGRWWGDTDSNGKQVRLWVTSVFEWCAPRPWVLIAFRFVPRSVAPQPSSSPNRAFKRTGQAQPGLGFFSSSLVQGYIRLSEPMGLRTPAGRKV